MDDKHEEQEKFNTELSKAAQSCNNDPDKDFKSLLPKAVNEVWRHLNAMHSVYDVFEDGVPNSMDPAHREWALEEVIEAMHSILDGAMDVIRYSCLEPEEYAICYPDEPTPDWLQDQIDSTEKE
jgi:hypothetical protein